MKKAICAVFVVAVVVTLRTEAMAVNIETVPIGNPGNAADTTGYGAVCYEYRIGKYEVTAGQYTEFLNAVAKTDTYGLYSTSMDSDYRGCKIQRSGSSGSYTYGVADDWANRPVNYVSWGDAARFANWLHNGQPNGGQDLTTTEDGAYFLDGVTSHDALMDVSRKADWKYAITNENEWYKAAYCDPATGGYFDYPTSSNTLPGYVNNNGNLSTTGTPFVEGGTDPGNYVTGDGDYIPSGIGSPYYRTTVGEWENSASPYGTFDQGGNVFEYNESAIYTGHNSPWSRGIRGGSYGDNLNYLQASVSTHHPPTLDWPGIGFRVSEVPEPATMTILILGGIGISRRRKRILG